MSSKILYFAGGEKPLFLTEFGCSAPEGARVIAPRVRDTYLLHYVLRGECRFCGKAVGQGEVFLIAPELLHDFSVSSGYCHYWLAFGGNEAAHLLSGLGLPVQAHAICGVRGRALAESILQAAFAAVCPEDEAERLALSALLALLPLLERRDAGKEQAPPFVETAACYIRMNYSRRITMAQVADYIHLTEKYFCKCFKEEMGMPPQKYLLAVRMERAKALLLETPLRIREIAQSVGYQSALTFSDIFKGYWGACPTQYRFQARQDREAEGKMAPTFVPGH